MKMFQINKELLPLKVILFCWFGAAACLLPYMTIHMRQLGITVEETAFVYAILPLTQIFGGPISGFIADKIGNYKPVLLISLILCIVSSITIMFVPTSGDPNAKHSEEDNYASHAFTFWLYFVLRILFQISVGICFTLLDATTLVLCDKHEETSFGKERFWAILATGLFSPICGLLIDYLSAGKDEFSQDYSPSFHFFNLLVLITAITLVILKIEVASPPKNMMKNFKPLLKSWKIWILLIVIFILGTCWGFVESFLFWYLLDLKSPKYLLGLTLTVGAFVGLPFLRKSEWFVEKAGHCNLMILALIFYLIRFVGYSLIDSPFWCIPFEAMEAFTYHLMWVAAATYSAQLAPEGLMATMIGIVGGLHYGVGRAAGSMFGGALMSIFDARIAFRIFGIIAGVTAVIYTAIYYIFIRRGEIKKLEQESKETKNIDENNVMLDVKHLNDNQKSNGDINTNTSISMYDINEIEGIPRKERCNSITSAISHFSANLAIAHPI